MNGEISSSKPPINDDKRKTAPPTSMTDDQLKIGVAPLRTSHIIKQGGSGASVVGGTTGNQPLPPKRIVSVSVSSSASAENLSPDQIRTPITSTTSTDQSTSSPAANSITNSKSSSSGSLMPGKPPAKVPPKIVPRTSVSMTNLAGGEGPAGSPSPSPSPSRISVSPNTSSSSLLSPDTKKQQLSIIIDTNSDDSNSMLGDNSSYMGDDSVLIENKGEDSDDETDEEEEELHENFLKELGLGNKDLINDLKEQEMKELELLAGGSRFRVTRCFVMAPTSTTNNSKTPNSSSPSQPIRKSIMQQPHSQLSSSPSSHQPSNVQTSSSSLLHAPVNNRLNRKTIFNPRFSIYRPGPSSSHAPPKKPLPAPPPRKLPATPKSYTPEQEQAAKKIQKAYRRYKQMIPFRKLKILYRYRWNIVQEIYNTEKTYLRTLGQLSAHFIEPLRKSGIISQDDVKFIFGGLDSIIAINTQLLNDIENILSKWTPYSILGKSFTTLGVFLKAYTDYVKNFDFSLQRIEACSKDIKFIAFLKAAEEKTNPRSRLESLLITPVQRIPRYVLLLQDLLKHTEPSHPDFSHISEGLDIIKKVAMSINDTKRKADNSLKVIEVQNKLVGKFPNLVVADRRYVHEGYILHGSSREKTKKLYIFLFNDILIFSKPQSNKIFSKSKFKFLKIEDLFPSPRIVDIPSNPIMQFAFEIELREHSFTLLSENEEIKKIWLDHFTKVFTDINNQNNITDRLEKRAVERADQAKTYIDNFFTNIKVKGRVTRGATIRAGPNDMVGQEDDGSNLSGSTSLASSTSSSASTSSDCPSPQSQQTGLLTRQQTFHNMTLLQREERLKGMAEETSQLKMEHKRMDLEKTFGQPPLLVGDNKYASVKIPQSAMSPMNGGSSMTMGRSTMSRADLENAGGTISDGNASLQEKKQKSGPPSLNKIFSSINLKTSDKDKEKEKEKEKGKPPLPSLSGTKPMFNKQTSSLNISLNNELATSLSNKNRSNNNQI